MKSKHTGVCGALAMALGLAICIPGFAATSAVTKVVAIPETNFSTPSSLNIFDTYVTEGYPPTQLTLKDGNGVCDFVEHPAFAFDGPQPICSSQLLAEKTGYTKVIPFNRPFSLHFRANQIQPVPFNLQGGPPPPAGPYGGTIFELHDTDPVFAQYGDPGTSGIRLVNQSGGYVFYANNISIWTGTLTPKTADAFQLEGVLQKNTSNSNDGYLVLKRNGVIVATSQGANCNGMTPTYPPVVGGGSSGPPPHPLTSGPHVRLGLGKVPTPYSPNTPPTTTEYYIDNAGAVYYQ